MNVGRCQMAVAAEQGELMRRLCSAIGKKMLLVVALIVAPLAAAQETNGCGSGWNRYLVPDSLRIVGCNFRPACDAHDICYGRCTVFKPGSSPPQCEYLRCESGGDLAGKPICHSTSFRDNRLAAEERRVKCDAAFMVDIVRSNPGNARCELFSGLYPFAVRVLGAKNFMGMDGSEQVAMSKADRQRYARAIQQLLDTWPEDRLAALALQIREGKAGVDLNRPIEFDPKRGLRNRPPSTR
ncbi:MAG: hypothetical protein GXC94_12795 [Comamonadaceae bacterium]|nr:hypothetical protein [Comamonadaceae bacterium]